METKYTDLAQGLEPNQDRDTWGINTEDEAVDNNATELSDNVEHATTGEGLQITQQKVQDDPRHQHFSQGKLSTPGTIDAASYSPRSGLKLPVTTRSSPPPPKPPPVTKPDVPITGNHDLTSSLTNLGEETHHPPDDTMRVTVEALQTGRPQAPTLVSR